MVLGFNEQFVNKILDGSKIHTIRFDNGNRWKVGNKIHFATGVRTKKYKQFMEGTCIDVQKILITRFNCNEFNISIDNKKLSRHQCELLSKKDGFNNLIDFIEWFLPLKNCSFEYGPHTWSGRLIHWTNFKY